MGLAEVSNILWRERHLLELLQCKLDVEQLLLATGRSRWLPIATDEIEGVLDELRHTELLRAIEVETVAAELGLPAGPSLRELAGAVPQPWSSIFDQHREALLVSTQEVRDVLSVNRDLLGRSHAALQALLRTSGADGAVLDGDGYGYGAAGKRGPGARSDRSAIVLDERW